MAVTFPNSPTIGQQVNVEGRLYEWDGSAWNAVTQVSVTDITGLEPTIIQPQLEFGYGSAQSGTEIRFYKDAFNVVHLEGRVSSAVTAQFSTVFILPEGYRPPDGRLVWLPTVTSDSGTLIPNIIIVGSNGQVQILNDESYFWTAFDGLTFKAE